MDLRSFLEADGAPISKSGLATAVGVTPSAVSQWCARLTRPSYDNAKAVEALTGGAVTVDEMMTFHPANAPIEQITGCSCPPGSAEACRHGDCPRNQRSAA